jgi:hypothetical protein
MLLVKATEDQTASGGIYYLEVQVAMAQKES